jgi:hypothetical protein
VRHENQDRLPIIILLFESYSNGITGHYNEWVNNIHSFSLEMKIYRGYSFYS